MLRTFLIEPASSRGPYDDKTTVTQGVVGYNLTISRRVAGQSYRLSVERHSFMLNGRQKPLDS